MRPVATLLLAASLALPAMPRADSLPPLPDFSDVSGNILSPAAERRLGQAFMRSVRANTKVIDDPVVDDYINDLGRRLTRHTSLGEDSFHFFLINDPTVNAFAGPGGNIGIHTGLILTSESESELAAVMAHEIAHITQHHLARTWQAASNMTVPQAAVLIAAAVLGATVGADAGLAAAMGGQAALLQHQIDFTRANEQEADRVGIDLLADAGFDARAMASFFTRMGRANRNQNIKLPEFLRTHPVTTSRIAEALDRANSLPYRQPTDDLRYQLLRERLRFHQQANLDSAVADLQRALADGRYRNKDAARYGLALALAADQRGAEGLSILKQLLAARPDVLEYAAAAAQVAAQIGDYGQALAILDQAKAHHPGSMPLMLLRCGLTLTAGKPAQALKIAETLIERRPEDPRVHALAARAYGALHQALPAHEQLAYVQYLRGNTEAAIQQLNIALRTPGLVFFDASRLEARREQYRQELATIRGSQ
jgi:predicted Zn-dependent protease